MKETKEHKGMDKCSCNPLRKHSQWFDDVASDLEAYDLSEEEINRIAMDYELMAESARLAEKSCINFLAIGSTAIPGRNEKDRYRHGSITGNSNYVAEDIAVAMLYDAVIERTVLEAVKRYRRMQRVLRKTNGEI